LGAGGGFGQAQLSSALRIEQVQRLVRLLAETADVPLGERRQHVIAGLRGILHAAVGGCVTDCDFEPRGRGAFTAVVLDGWDATTLATIEALAKNGSMWHPALRQLALVCPTSPGSLAAGTRTELVADRAWYSSEFVEGFMLPACIDHGLFSSMRGSSPSVVQGLGFYRERNDRPFDEGDRALLQLFHVECQRILAAPAKDVNEMLVRRLSPRQFETLRQLREGLADKEIAARLGISPHTVNHYTKQIYRQFGVQSRAALVAKLAGAA
jgi:DNA-binding CsgD family transcriptional regulator